MPTTDPTPPLLPGVSRLILVASEQYPRYSEADVAALPDGRLLLAVARKEGGSDFARGTLIGMFSTDQGASWDDEPHVIQASFDDVGDVMSVSFVRTPRGLHLFFLGRGPSQKRDTRIYQLLSSDDGKTWGKPVRVSSRQGYHIVNNARVIRTSKGRLIIPISFAPDIAGNGFRTLRLFSLSSDDDGVNWKPSNDLTLDGQPLMEPGVVECGDGSIYMTIRTAVGVLYEARSADDGTTWTDLKPTKLPAPAAPSTVVRDPASSDLWLFWCPSAKAKWKDRTPQVFAVSKDHGHTWSEPRPIEHDPKHGYGYISVTPLREQALLTYYDWRDGGQKDFVGTSLRQRVVPLAWLRGQPAPPVFRRSSEQPVLKHDQAFEGDIVSANSGLLVDKERWRLWYTTGALGPKGEQLKVCAAESRDAGVTWKKSGVALPVKNGSGENVYHPSVHRDGTSLVLYAWRRDKDRNGLYRYTSSDDGLTFAPDPDEPIVASPFAPPAERERAGDGMTTNDAFDVIRNRAGGFDLFAAVLRKATDPRTIIQHDNAAGWIRIIGRSSSGDGIRFSTVDVVIEPSYGTADAPDTQFYGIQVLRYRDFYLGLLHVFHAQSQVIHPEWAWSHDGVSWARTGLPAMSLGDEGSFDSRMVLFGSLAWSGEELVWLYAGSNWRHNAFRLGKVSSAIGRALLPRRELDAWLDSLPQP